MNTRKLTVIGVLVLVAIAFVAGLLFYRQQTQTATEQHVRAEAVRLVRMHSPVLGPQDAPVTLVEFFDPACEACRAFYPYVKNIMAQHPDTVRLVIRYAPFHHGSDEVVRLLEAARRQNRFVPVLEALLEAQPQWADHAQPNLALALQAAQRAGLDLERAAEVARTPAVDAVLKQDVEDLTALKVNRTPTFFVNGRSLPSFGPEQLATLVAEEVAAARR